MKRFYLLAAIAIFMTGSLTRATAQDAKENAPALRSGHVLKVKAASGLRMTQPTRSINRTDATADGNCYWVTAQSYLDEYYGVTDGAKTSETDYTTQVTIDGDKAVFTNIVDNSYFWGWEGCSEVVGDYDAEKGTVTIRTPLIKDGNTRDDYTVIGELYMYGTQTYVILVAGDLSTVPDENGNYPLYQESKLVFDVSADGTELIPRTGYGSATMNPDNNTTLSFLNYYKSAKFEKMADEPKLIISPAELDLTGETVYAGLPYSTSFKLKNLGLTDAQCSLTTSSDELTVDDRDIDNWGEAAMVTTVPLTLNMANEGDFTGTITITDQNGASSTMTVKAAVSALPDYSPVIKNGDLSITPTLTSTSAMAVTDTITGFPVLVSTNTGDNSLSTVSILFTVPQGQIATFSWKGFATGMYPNMAVITLDGNSIYSLDIFDGNPTHDLSDKIILESGVHQMEFGYNIQVDWYTNRNIGDKLYAYFYDFDLTTFPDTDYAVDVYDDQIDFGTFYYDKIAKTDTASVILYNVGSKPLEVTAVEGDGTFSGIADGLIIEPYETGTVALLFNREGVGDHVGDVVIKTTAGDVTVHCTAKTEKIIYDYSPIVVEGDFSFDTSRDYPWLVDGNKAYSSTSGMTPYGDLDSWIEASFIVPEGQTGELSWSGQNSSWDYMIFMGEKIFTDGTIVFIDNVEVARFAGIVSASSDMVDVPLTFSEGQHSVRFLYKKVSSTFEGEDLCRLYNLSLVLNGGTGVDNATCGSETLRPVKVEYYSASGAKISSPSKGVNIVKESYADGSCKTRKLMVR